VITAHCVECGATFRRAEEQRWKLRCIGCWQRRKSSRAPRFQVDPLRVELADNLRPLLSLCHPDRHGGSMLATRTTQWLLSIRKRVGNVPP